MLTKLSYPGGEVIERRYRAACAHRTRDNTDDHLRPQPRHSK